MKRILSFIIYSYSLQSFSVVQLKSDLLQTLALPNLNQKFLIKDNNETAKQLTELAVDQHLDLNIRWKALMALGRMNPSLNSSFIEPLLKQKEWFVKNGLLVALDEHQHPQRISLAKKLIRDPSLIVRSAAVDILINNEKERDILWDVFYDSQNIKKGRSLWIRSKVLKYLSQNPRPYEKTLLEKIKLESDPELKKIASKALDQITNTKSNK